MPKGIAGDSRAVYFPPIQNMGDEMKLTIALMIAALAAPALAAAEKKPAMDPEIVNAQAAVRMQLKDPESARFQNVRRKILVGNDGVSRDVVCGQVNAKNGFGGYAGNDWFFYNIAAKRATILNGMPPAKGACD